MRKILTIALVALMAASLFAGVKTSGYVQGAAHASIPDGGDISVFDLDNDNKAQVNINDENKVWGTTLTVQPTKVGAAKVETGKFATKTWVDVMKLAQTESDVAVKVTFMTWDKLATLSAYKNNADEKNTWRLRDENEGISANVEIGYSKYVKGQVGIQFYNGSMTADNRKDQMALVASVLGTPTDGVKLSAGYLMYDFDSGNDATGFVVAGDVDAGKLADLDFSLGVGAAYRHLEKKDTDVLTMQVYGDYEGIGAYAEITMLDNSYLKVGASYAFNEKLDAGAYVFFGDYEDIDFDKNVTLGAETNYVLNKQISFYGNVEYAAKDFSVEARVKVKF